MNSRIVILGAGESGTGAALLAKKEGMEVFVSDKGQIKDKYIAELEEAAIEWESGKHSEEKILNATEVIKSPGIPDNVDLIKKLKSKGIPVISEIEFAYRYTDAKIVAITGSNGKSTATTLTYHILKNGGLNVGIGGNIGTSFARLVAEENYSHFVLEVSSFQLDGIRTFKPDVAILLNITHDHLDRYDYKLENYAKAKFRITMNQDESDHFIYCSDDPITTQYFNSAVITAHKIPFSQQSTIMDGAFVKDDEMIIQLKKKHSECLFTT